MNIYDHLARSAKILPHQPAILFESHAFTYEQLEKRATAAATLLEAAGVNAGDRVAIMLPNVPAFAVWYYAALRLGAIAVSLSTRLVESEVSFVINDCTAKVLIISSEPDRSFKTSGNLQRVFAVDDLGCSCDGQDLKPGLESKPAIYNAQPDEPALILYTSGTTGFPKGATLSHNNVNSNVCAFNHLCEMSQQDVILLTVPLFHCFGQNALLNSGFNAGLTLVLQRKFDPQESKRLIVEHAVTQLYGVPAMFQMLNDCCSTEDLNSVGYCFTAASTMPVQIADRWQQTYGLPLYEGYGLTETSPFASYNHRLEFVRGSIGAPIDNVQMKIVDTQTKQDCAPDELGEIAIRGPNVMLGYWNRPEETAAAIVDGWFYSGDIGRVDESGYFFIVDRVKDMISIGGLKVYPAEVERVLLDVKGVRQAAVVGFSNGVLGEEVAAFLVKDDAADDSLNAEVKTFCRQHLANYKTPKHIFWIDELPRNPSGKVLKTELRAQQASLLSSVQNNGEDAQANAVDRNRRLLPLLQSAYPSEQNRVASSYLQNVVCEITGDESKLNIDDPLLESGLDSLMLVELSHRLQIEVGDVTDISATVIFDYPTIGQLSEFLVGCLTDNNTESIQRELTTARVSENSLDHQSEDEVAAMSEQQVLAALLKELDDDV